MAQTQIHGANQIKDATITNAKISASAAIALSKLATDPLARGNHTGTQLAATISNFLATVLTARLDQMAAPTADVNLNNRKITALLAGTAAGDAVNYQQLQDAKNNIDRKDSVRVATSANVVLTGPGAAIDGVTLSTTANGGLGDRVLLYGQTTGSQNGLYFFKGAAATMVRTDDADANAEVTAGLTTVVEEGTMADKRAILITDNPITLGTTALTFTFESTGESIFGGAGLTKTGGTLDVVSANAAIVANADNIALTLATNSLLEIVAGGLRLARGSGGQIIVVNASGDPVMATMSGDATLSAAGVLTLAATVTKNTAFVDREIPTGSINSSNVTFTLANIAIAGSEHVYLNGILQEPGAGNDYTISGATITYLTAPITGDKLRVTYRQ